ncbi:protein-disulfide reductase DsbD family protein [Gayadomonas joobiniege]|uniref:protein-disulfide reductase DsbD family protein n=1 Tax=Gayadomonas joobiniege TaxID=1234606 RepID=UPI00036FB3D4|nr:protein-disulfide reductase DsbD domain-containing protein [Gayadomonas joobiniege]
MRLFSFLLFTFLFQFSSQAAEQKNSAAGPHISVSLVSELDALIPHQTNWIAVLLQPEKGWHTYWKNPGDSGEAPKFNWQPNSHLTYGEIEWPLPQAIKVAHLVNYGYEGDTLLMVPIEFSDTAKAHRPEKLTVALDLSWLVCKEDCIPGWASLALTLPIQTKASASEHAKLFANTRMRLPQAKQLTAQHEITDRHIIVQMQLPYPSSWRLYPTNDSIIEHSRSQQKVVLDNNQTSFQLMKSAFFNPNKAPIQFLVTDGRQGYYVNSQLNTPDSINSSTPQSNNTQKDNNLAVLMLMAFVGGLVLNLMPCVLPVLAIKALSLQTNMRSVWSKLAYAIGVLVSFNLLALLLILLKETGQSIGWGFQMQSPVFIAVMAFLFLSIALALLDQFKINDRFSGIGQQLTQGNGFKSQFFTGVLAVVVASPCTAPFMAASIGIALISPALVTFLLFSSLAIGFALPLTLMSWLPVCRRLLPKPGAWMIKFKHFLAFPMLATVIWLVWIYLNQSSHFNLLVLLSSLLLFAFAIWLFGFKSFWIRGFACLTLLTSLTLPTVIFPPEPKDFERASQNTLTSIDYDAKTLAKLRQDNQIILVNMTADWCITCKVNEQTAFNTEAFKNAIKVENVHYMVGDWTNKDEHIFKFLTEYNRAGVPLYVLYIGNKREQILPQLLTSKQVVNALNQAQKEINNET